MPVSITHLIPNFEKNHGSNSKNNISDIWPNVILKPGSAIPAVRIYRGTYVKYVAKGTLIRSSPIMKMINVRDWSFLNASTPITSRKENFFPVPGGGIYGRVKLYKPINIPPMPEI